jgi:hypothetical protein
MDNAGNINFEMVPEYYNFLKKNGVVGAFLALPVTLVYILLLATIKPITIDKVED